MLLLWLMPQPCYAVTVREVPNPRHHQSWVTDMAHLLEPQTQTKINQLITALEQANGDEVAIVTIPETSSILSPKQFATELFNTWQVGKRNRDNGVLFLVAAQERRVEIETGYGIEVILTDAQVKQIIDEQIIPAFQQGDFDRGILQGTKAIVRALESYPTASMPKGRTPAELGFTAILYLAGIVLVGSLLALTSTAFAWVGSTLTAELERWWQSQRPRSLGRKRSSEQRKNSPEDSLREQTYTEIYGRSSSSSNYSGGGDFGGGHSGGGGAGGHW